MSGRTDCQEKAPREELGELEEEGKQQHMGQQGGQRSFEDKPPQAAKQVGVAEQDMG